MLHWKKVMDRRQYREWKKNQLLRQIQQQRLELASSKILWLKKTESVDHAWQTVLSSYVPIAIGTSLIAVCAFRHPGKLILWSNRIFKFWGFFRLLQKNLQR